MKLSTSILTKNFKLSTATSKFKKKPENKPKLNFEIPKHPNTKTTTFNILRKKNTDARTKAQIINTLREKSLEEFKTNNAHTKYRNITMFALIFLTESTFIYSTDFSEIYESKINYEEKLKKKFLSKSSFINTFLTYFSVVERIRTLNPNIILTLFSLLISLQLFFLLLYKWNNIVEKILLSYKDKEGNLKIKNKTIKFYHLIFKNFDLIFLLLNYIGISSLFCRTIQIPITKGGEEDLISTSSIKNDYNSWLGTNLEERTIPLEVHFLSSDVKCLNSERSKIALNILGLLILGLNLLIKKIFNRIHCFVPSVSIPQSKFGNFDLFIDFAMIGAIFLRVTTTSYFAEDFESLKLVMIFFFFALVSVYVIMFGKYPYYCKHFSSKKKLQLSLLMTLTATHIMISNKFLGAQMFDDQIATLIFFLIAVTMNIRISKNSNLPSEPSTILEKILYGKLDRKLTVKEVLAIYYSVTKFIHSIIVAKTKNLDLTLEAKKTTLMITSLFKRHQQRCSSINCICQKKDLRKYMKYTSLNIALDNQIFNDSDFTYKGILLCEDLLKKNSVSHKEENQLVFYTYMEFMINYFGQPVEANRLLRKRMNFLGRDREDVLEFEILKETLDNIVALNHMNGTLALAIYHDIIHLERKSKKDTVDVQNHIMFLNSVEKLKQEIYECSEKKLEILNNLIKNPNSQIFFEGAKEFSCQKIHIFFFSEKLLVKSRGLYPPLLLIMWRFLKDICQDYISSNGYLTLLKKSAKKKYFNLNKIFYNKTRIRLNKMQEFCAIYASGEENTYHQIKYCTSNMFDLTGWKNHELADQDLNLIIPPIFKKYHKEIMGKKFFKGTLLTLNNYRNLFCMSRLGYLKPMKMSLRLNENISMELQFVSIMHFDLQNKFLDDHHCILITDREGHIKSMTKSAKNFFQNGENIFDHNSDLERVYKSFDDITNDKLRGEKLDGDYYKIMDDEKKKMAWRDYLKWSKPSYIKMKNCILKMKIQDFLLTQVRKVIRFIVIENINDEKFYQSFDVKSKHLRKKSIKLEMKERKNIESMLRKSETIGSKITNPQSSSKDDFDFIPNERKIKPKTSRNYGDEEERFGEEEKFLTKRADYMEKGFYLKKKEKSQENSIKLKIPKLKQKKSIFGNSEEKNIEMENLEEGVFQFNFEENYDKKSKPKSVPLEEEDSESYSHSEKDIVKKKDILKIDEFEKSKNHPFFKLSKLIHHHPSLNLIRNGNDIVKSKSKILTLIESDVHFTGHEPTSKLGKNIFNISKIDIKKYSVFHKSAKISIILIIIIALINIILVNQKSYIQEITTKEVPNMLVITDIFCWIVWVELYGIMSLEGNRAVREGWIGKYDMKKYLDGKSYWEDAYFKQKSSGLWAFVDLAQKTYDTKIRKITYPDLFHGYEGVFKDELGVDFYRIGQGGEGRVSVNEEKNKGYMSIGNEVEWYKVDMGRRDSLKLLDLAGRIYLKRNYENDSVEDIPSLGKERDRNRDPFEDYLRKLLIGESFYKVMLKNWDNYEYIKDVSGRNEYMIFLCSVGSTLSSGFLLIGFMIYILKLKSDMNNFYRLIFSFKVNLLEQATEEYKKRYYKLKYLLKDEKTEEYQNKHLRKLKKMIGFGTKLKLLRFGDEPIGKMKNRVNSTRNAPEVPKKVRKNSEKLILHMKKRKKRKKPKRAKTLKLGSKKFSFGLTILFTSTILAIILLSLAHAVEYFTFGPKAKRITNLAKVAILSIESWNGYWTLHTAMIETVFYNNTVKMWNNVNSEELYYDYRKKIKNYIIENFTEALDYDLGNFTERFRDDLSTGNSCKRVYHYEEADEKALPFCHEWYDGLMNSNLLSSFKGMLTSLDHIMDEWKQKRGSWDQVDQIFQTSTFLPIISKLRRIWIVSYYWASKPATNIINKQLEEDKELMGIVDMFFFAFLFLILVFMYFQIVLKLQEIMIYYSFGLSVLPLKLVQKNNALKVVLKKAHDGEKRVL